MLLRNGAVTTTGEVVIEILEGGPNEPSHEEAKGEKD
jgi:hypothetical protein